MLSPDVFSRDVRFPRKKEAPRIRLPKLVLDVEVVSVGVGWGGIARARVGIETVGRISADDSIALCRA